MSHLRKNVALSVLLGFAFSNCLLTTEQTYAQAVAGATNAKVGNATAYPLSNYVMNPLTIADPGIGSETRHGRQNGSTGIGGSYLGTENVNSETAKATTPMYQPVLRNPAMSQATSYDYYSSPQLSPALRSATDRSRLFGSGIAPSFEQSNYSSPTNTGLDALPSFNRTTIIQGYSHGGRSWIGQ